MPDQTITALKVQTRNPNRINVYLDGEFAFGLARIVAAWLRIGMQLSPAKVEDLRRKDDLEKAYERAIQFIGYRPRSEAEVTRRLQEKGVQPEVAAQVVERLLRAGLLQDDEFAKAWVENRSAFRPRGRRLLAMELRQKGISDDVIQQSLPDVEAEVGLALEAGRKYARRLVITDWDTFQRKLGGFLLRRGFSYGDVKPVVRQIWNEQRSSTELLMENDEADYDESK